MTDTVRLPMRQIVAELIDAAGPTLVAYMADVASRQMPARWASDPGDPRHVVPRDPAKQRLMLAHEVLTRIAAHESADIARAWLIGSNPRLAGFPPADYIREFAAAEVYGAMQAFIDDTGGA